MGSMDREVKEDRLKNTSHHAFEDQITKFLYTEEQKMTGHWQTAHRRLSLFIPGSKKNIDMKERLVKIDLG